MVSSEKIAQVVKKIADEVNPKKIYLFGSYAYGEPNEDSDIDLMVIDDQGRDLIDYAYQIQLMFCPRDFAMDVLCVSDEDYSDKLSKGWEIYREIDSKGKLLYDRR